MSNTFFSHSFGCRVNQAEKEELDRQLTQLGYEYKAENPDFFVINSCSITNKAEREAKQLIYQLKRKNPEMKIIVTGCAATNWVKTRQNIPEIDLLVDNVNKEYLASLITKNLNRRPVSVDMPQAALSQDKFQKSGRVIIKIQDGCQRFCTYCIVPYLRGLPKSTPIQVIIDKINSVPNGKEAILTAINTEAYGYDTKVSFYDLVTAVLEGTTIPRISFGSVHPWSVNDTFFNLYKNHPQAYRMMNFFHVPLQSGSNKMLKLMKRGYTREEFVEKLKTLAEIRPFTFIGTDVIVGFLEETDADFQDTYDFLEQSPIQKFHIFRFSKRQHTAAFYLSKRLNEPDPQSKIKRAHALAELTKKKYGKFLQEHVDHTFSALFLEKRNENLQSALLENQIPVQVETVTDLTGEIKNVKISSYKNGTLFGRIV